MRTSNPTPLMISQTSKYALRILGYLVDHPGQWVLARDIAEKTGIPGNYLAKILNQLRKRGFVLSRKGWGGGFRLRDRAQALPVAEVVHLFEGHGAEEECPFGFDECESEHPCPLHMHWNKIRASYEEMLSETKIADLRHAHLPAARKRTRKRR